MVEQLSPSEIISILPITDNRWMEYISKNPQSNIFHHPAWSQLLAKCYGFNSRLFITCDTKDNILAGLPVMMIHSILNGPKWVSLPFTDHCNPLYDHPSALFRLMDGLVKQAQVQGIQNVEFRGEFLSDPNIYQSRRYAFHSLRLESDLAKVSCRIHPMHLRNAKTALNRGVRVRWGSSSLDLDAFYRLHLHSRRRQGVPVQPRYFFQLIGNLLFSAGLGSILFAYKDEKIVAALLLLKYGETLTYKFGASDKTNLSLRPNDLLFWTAIQWGCENGYKVFDMGRTDLDNSGLIRFKQGWGADEIPLTYYSTSLKNQNQTSGNLVYLMKPIIQHSPLWVCRLLGELLYRHFG
jgi:CelD/BcsL family acetyltransferase involved in cellulose biosynthesis